MFELQSVPKPKVQLMWPDFDQETLPDGVFKFVLLI